MQRLPFFLLLSAALLLRPLVSSAQTWESLNGPSRDWQARDLSVSNAGGLVRLWIADEDRVKVSANGGTGWTATQDPILNPLLVGADPSREGWIHAAIEGLLRRSTTGGVTWTQAVHQPGAVPLSLAVSASNADRWFLGTDTVLASGVWKTSLHRSTNGGEAWTVVQDFSTIRTWINDVLAGPTAAFPNHVLACGSNTAPHLAAETEAINEIEGLTRGVWLSTSNGENNSWVSVTGSITAADKNLTAAAASLHEGTLRVLVASARSTGARILSCANFDGNWTVSAILSGVTHVRALRVKPDQPQTIVAATNRGVYVSGNQGVSWTAKSSGLGEDLDVRDVVFDPGSSSTLYAAMYSSTYKSTNLGETWTRIPSGSTPVNVSALSVNNGTVLAVSRSYPAVHRFAGSSWSVPAFPAGTGFQGEGAAHHPNSPSSAVIAGATPSGNDMRAALYYSSNGGASWPSTVTFDGASGNSAFRGIAADPKTGSQRVYAYGSTSSNSGKQLYWSDSYGAAWSTANGADVDGGLSASAVIALQTDPTPGGSPSANVLSGTDGQGGWRSVNAGGNWASINGVGNTTLNSIALNQASPQIVYFGTSGGMYKSVDGGVSLTTLTPGFTGALRLSIHPSYGSSPNHLWAIPANGQAIYKSVNGGQAWSQVSTTGLGLPLNDLKADPVSNRYVYVGTSAGIVRVDPPPEALSGVQAAPSGGHPGITWTAGPETDLHGTARYRVYRYYRYCTSYFPNKQCGSPVDTVCLTPAGITSTSFVDADWDIICQGCYGTGLRIAGYFVRAFDVGGNASAGSASVEFTVGDSGPINPDKRGERIPTSFALGPNFPNPFNPTTTMTYALPQESYVILEIVDLLGRVVMTLVDEQQDAGFKEVRVDATQLSSGVYFYRLSAGSFTAMRKMMIMK